jgi:hypothetical protein
VFWTDPNDDEGAFQLDPADDEFDGEARLFFVHACRPGQREPKVVAVRRFMQCDARPSI